MCNSTCISIITTYTYKYTPFYLDTSNLSLMSWCQLPNRNFNPLPLALAQGNLLRWWSAHAKLPRPIPLKANQLRNCCFRNLAICLQLSLVVNIPHVWDQTEFGIFCCFFKDDCCFLLFQLTFCFPFHLSFVPWIPVFVDVFLRAISLPFLACFLDYQHWCLILQDFFLFCKDLCPLYGFDPILIGFLHWSLVYATYIYYEPPSISASHDLLHPFILPWLVWFSIINFLVLYTICSTQSLPHLAAGFCFHFFSCHCSGVAVLECTMIIWSWREVGGGHTASPTRGTTTAPLPFASLGSASWW